MTNEQLSPKVRAWLKTTDAAPEDVRRSITVVSDQTRRTRQRSRWWPLPSLRRPEPPAHRARSPVHGAATPPPPMSTPTPNGQFPTITGRTHSMFSPAKAILAGALVFTIGGAFLIAQPFDQGPGFPGAATEEGPAAPVAVTATSYAGGCPGIPTTETNGFVTRTVGSTCRPTWGWSDERLNGTVTWAVNEDVYTDGSDLTIEMLALSFENEDGAWRMRPLPVVSFPDAPEVAADVWVLDGEGAYEGFTAVLLVENYLPHGFIIDGELPPAPENSSTK